MDMVKTEFCKAQQPQMERNTRRTRAQQETANNYQTNYSTCILDSAAAPSFITPISAETKPLTINATFWMATGTVAAHKQIPAVLNVPAGKPLTFLPFTCRIFRTIKSRSVTASPHRDR